MNRKLNLDQILETIKEIKVGMMSTFLARIPHNTFPMGVQQIDGNGDLWFFSNRTSNHFEDIKVDKRVQITYSNESKQVYLSLFAEAYIIEDKVKIDELWNPMLKTWFKDKNDDDLILLKVEIKEAKYWDEETNDMIRLRNVEEVYVQRN